MQIGSVDEESTKSDEEYDDLAMQDILDSGYQSDEDDEEVKIKIEHDFMDQFRLQKGFKYSQNLEPFQQSKKGTFEPLHSYSSVHTEKNEAVF